MIEHMKTTGSVLTPLYLMLILGTPLICLAEEVTLTVLHTNDTYGRLLTYPVKNLIMGGVLRRAYLIQQVRKESQNTIVLDAGDAIGPYPLADFDSGETVIRMMNMMGYTAMALGNHEFSYGLDVLRERSAQAQFPMLSANTYAKDTDKLLTQAYVIREVAGIKVGLIGLTTPTTRYRASPELQKSLRLDDPIASAKSAVGELQAYGCDLIIALSHLGYQGDMELIAQVKEINLIVGSEVELPTEKTISVMSPIDTTAGTTMVYCPWFGGYLGRVDVRLEKSHEGFVVKNVEAGQYRLDSVTYPDEVILPVVADLKAELDNLVRSYQDSNAGILGQIAEGEAIDVLDLVPLVIRKITKAEIVMLNRGSIRPESFRGDIHRVQVIESIKYSNEMVILELSGSQLKDALTHSNKQVSESRKLVLLGLDAAGEKVNSRVINPNEYYSVVTNDFLASGGDGYEMIAVARRKRRTGLFLRQAVVDYIVELHASGQALSLAPLMASVPRLLVKSKVGTDLTLKGTTISESTESYPQIKLLQSKNIGDFFHWSIQMDLSTFMAMSEYDLELDLVSKYGRLQHPQLPSIELDDSTKASAVFRYLFENRKLHPIARLEVENIEFTPSEERHTTTQLSAGVERKMPYGFTLSGGILYRRHRPAEGTENQVNTDLRAQYKSATKSIQVQSEFRFFPIIYTTASGSDIFRDYIGAFTFAARFPFRKYLYLSSSIIAYRETRIGSWAYNAEIAAQLHHSWGKKL